MKNSKFIKLFSALLCIVMLFVSCGGGTGNNNPDSKDDTPASLTISDLVYLDNTAEKITAAEKLDFGELVDGNGNLAVFEKVESDAKANAKFTTTVYNLSLGKVVFSAESEISQGTITYVEGHTPILLGTPFVSVEKLTDGPFGATVLVSSKIEKIDVPKKELDEKIQALRAYYGIDPSLPESMIPSNQLSYSYLEAVSALEKYYYVVSYEIYDVSGKNVDTVKHVRLDDEELFNFVIFRDTLLAETLDMSVLAPDFNESTVDYEPLASESGIVNFSLPFSLTYRIEDRMHVFALNSVVNSDIIYEHERTMPVAGNIARVVDATNGDYDVYFNTDDDVITSLTIVEAATSKLVANINVEDIADEFAKKDVYDGDYTARAYMLKDGKLLLDIAAEYSSDEKGYDYYDDGTYYDVIRVAVNLSNGYYKEIDIGLDFVIHTLVSFSDYSKLMSALGAGKAKELPDGLSIVQGYEIERNDVGEKILGSTTLYVVDKNFNVLLDSMKPLAPEHDPYGGSTPLPTGDFLVDLVETAPSDKAIVTIDGKIRCYLPKDAKIMGEFIVTARGIYDYDLKLLFNFEENDATLRYKNAVFGKFFVDWVDAEYIEFSQNTDKNGNGILDSEESISVYDDKNGNGIYDWEEEDFDYEKYDKLWNDDSGLFVLNYKDGAFTMERFNGSLGNDGEEGEGYYNPYPFYSGLVDNIVELNDYYLIAEEEYSDSKTNSEHTRTILYNSEFDAIVAVTDGDISVIRCGDFYYAMVHDTNGYRYYALNGAAASK